MKVLTLIINDEFTDDKTPDGWRTFETVNGDVFSVLATDVIAIKLLKSITYRMRAPFFPFQENLRYRLLEIQPDGMLTIQVMSGQHKIYRDVPPESLVEVSETPSP